MGTEALSFDLDVNGCTVRAEGLAPQTTLLDFLRSRGLTGSKEGCAEGECGACTVVIRSENGYTPVNSCLLFVPMAAGQEIYTVEALARDGKLAEAQQAMVECAGSQCGYCTPGFVMSLFAEQYRPGREGPCDIHALSGNLCRCTGYQPIREAARRLGLAPDDYFRRRLDQPAPVLRPIETAGFSRPATLDACLRLLREHPEARLIAGGTDLAVESNLKLRRFPHLISVEAVPELRVFRESLDAVEIGAGLTLSEIDRRWTDAPPVWREWTPLFASPLIRNRATLGGNLATASPIGDAAPMLLALDARVRIAGQSGERETPLDRFFLGYRKTELIPGEVLVSIIIPKPLPRIARFYKIAKRRIDDISTVAACFAIGEDGRMRLAYGGVAATPVKIAEREIAALRPISDHRGSSGYRLALAQSLLEKFRWESAA